MSKAFVDAHRSSAERVTGPAIGTAAPDAHWLGLVAEKVNSLHYGVIQIVVHDSRVVQVERTERHRFEVQRGS